MIRKHHPATIIILSFLDCISVGTALLTLPISNATGHITFMDALFTVTSAVCVTGLTILDTGSHFTLFGQTVILILIQVGGLGLMTISVVFFKFLGMNVSFQHRRVMQESFSHTPRKDIYALLKSIFIFSGLTELLGAFLLAIYWSNDFPIPQAVYLALFHSVSAFCNAGFSLFAANLLDYRDSVTVNLTICGLIILGGIGFPVIFDIYENLSKRRRKRIKFSLQTKVATTATAILIFAGMFLYLALEQQHSMKGLNPTQKILSAFFQSVTARTAGFNTLDFSTFSNAGAFLTMILMFIGASPGSCAGGVKTTTITVLAVSAIARLKGIFHPSIYKKSISDSNVMKSLAIVGISIFFITVIFFLILLSQPSTPVQSPMAVNQFRNYLFEVLSAFGTVGLSMGATKLINDWGRFLLVIMMLIGRVGVLSFFYFIVGDDKKAKIEYSEESIMLG
jgi:trk system potassium uptake protein TrkH